MPAVCATTRTRLGTDALTPFCFVYDAVLVGTFAPLAASAAKRYISDTRTLDPTGISRSISVWSGARKETPSDFQNAAAPRGSS